MTPNKLPPLPELSYRKKPVVIEAVQWDGKQLAVVPKWLSEAINKQPMEVGGVFRVGSDIHVFTLEGTTIASPGDWIIRGIKGELYACKPDIFAATYEPAEALRQSQSLPAGAVAGLVGKWRSRALCGGPAYLAQVGRCADELEQALQADAREKGEAVAWMEPNEGGVIRAEVKATALWASIYSIPLYTQPAQESDQDDKYSDFTRAELIDLLDKAYDQLNGKPVGAEAVADLCRAIDRFATQPVTPAGGECDACGGSGYTVRPSGSTACWKCSDKAPAGGEVPLGALCALLMCSDPWPVQDGGLGDGRESVAAFIDELAHKAGFNGWLDAYHSTAENYVARPPVADAALAELNRPVPAKSYTAMEAAMLALSGLAEQFDEMAWAASRDGESERRDVWQAAASQARSRAKDPAWIAALNQRGGG